MGADGVFVPLLALLLAGLFAQRAARAVRLPDVVAYVAAGVLLGPVLHVVPVAIGGGVTRNLLTFGAAFMLLIGGRRLGLRTLREIWLGLTLLATVGVLVTGTVSAVASRYLLHLPWSAAALLGAVLSATDPATIIPLFRAVTVRPRLARLVEAESACNDALAALLTLGMVGLVAHGRIAVGGALGSLPWMIGGAVLAGAGTGVVASWLMPGGRGLGLLDTREQGAVLSLAVVLGAYAGAQALGASGYLAVFVAGVVLGNRHALGLEPPSTHRRVHEAYLGQVGLLVRMLVFLVLGAAVQLDLVARVLLPALAVAAVLLLVARPMAVLACLPADRVARWTAGEVAFAAWVRETGVVPAALGGLLLQEQVPGADTIAAVVFVAVLVSILVQPTTTRWWALRCGVALPDREPGGRTAA